ncbi:ClpP/crotonase [Sistotremastrum niveocremeum HHB9708]|uniref:ClpP/crotonase n=1 Tax=Sistotremastrum niveocremeum HHB9708 TaxID=1314777 RepID=A0A164TUY7_9AGAM|nr:ClpP/crotonase [Sistotremastrum niveocremeum HHB9708]
MSSQVGFPAKAPLATVTRPSEDVWILELHNGEDNRLTDIFIRDSIMPALDHVEREWRQGWRSAQAAKDPKKGAGALIIVGKRGQDKFFSNGLDYKNVAGKHWFFRQTFNPFISRLMLFPIPTIAALNGHTFAGGFLVAMACDYRVMIDGIKRRAWGSMNEITFAAPWPRSFAVLFRAKTREPNLVRKIALEAARITPQEMLDGGLIDEIGGSNTEEVIQTAVKLGKKWGPNAATGVWGVIKADIYYDVLDSLSQDLRASSAEEEDLYAKARL